MRLHLLAATLLVTGLFRSALPGADTQAEIYLTAKGTDARISRQAPAPFIPLDQPEESQPTVFLDPAKSFQTIVGIGGAVTDATAEVLGKLPPKVRTEVIRDYFDPVAGLGYSLVRTHIHSCDFSSASYTYTKDGDASLASFSVAPDEKYRLPLLRDAQAAAGGKLTVFASPWSPPAWMKTNGDMLQGGKLKPEHRATWAAYLVKFIKAYEQAGVPIWGMTVQNEPMAKQPWESCIFTGNEERDFVRDHLGPALHGADLARIKLMVWDHNRGMMYQRGKSVYDDPEAAKYVWGLAYHWYVNDTFDNARLLHDAYPDKHLLFSEGCLYPYSTAKLDEWEHGERYGLSIISDFNAWATGWTDWNLVLDMQGGPNHVDNFCFAPVHADPATGAVRKMNSFHYIGHFSKFVRPGAKRIAATASVDQLKVTAFANPDGGVVGVVMNQGDKACDFLCWIAGKAAQVACPPRSIITVTIKP